MAISDDFPDKNVNPILNARSGFYEWSKRLMYGEAVAVRSTTQRAVASVTGDTGCAASYIRSGTLGRISQSLNP